VILTGFYVVVYDIGDTGKRNRVIITLERWGLRRIQRSAFVGQIPEGRAKDVAREIEMIIVLEKDVVHMIQIDRREWEKAIVIGTSAWSSGLKNNAVIMD